MSRESILKIQEAETQAEALIERARVQAQEMIANAEAEGNALCEQTEVETTEQMRGLLLQLREKTDEMDGRAMADSEEEIALIRKNARLNRKIAEKIIIRGLDTKCR